MSKNKELDTSNALLADLDRILESKIKPVSGKREYRPQGNVKAAVDLMITPTGKFRTVNQWAKMLGKAGNALSYDQIDLLRFLMKMGAVVLIPSPPNPRRRPLRQ